jgi:hypothetical protein
VIKPVKLLAFAALALLPLLQFQAARANPATLLVPTAYSTIQSAINAADAGDTVRVLAGTYIEQLRISKNLTIEGAGIDRTIVRAPSTLALNGLGETSTVEISGGAVVTMSRLSVNGPGSGTCASGSLNSGIRVYGEGHFDFSHGAVRNIHDTPRAGCFRSGTAILVGDVPDPPASLDIDHSEVTSYQAAGIVVLGFGSTANITHNTVAGPGFAGGVATDGIEFPVGSVGTITHNIVSGNICPPSDTGCGPDWFSQFQHAGILAGGWGPGTVVSHNVVFDNQIGLFLGEADEIKNNVMQNSHFFGIGLIDGTFLIDHAQIKGGAGGVWVIAQGANTTAVLDHVSYSGLSGPEVEELECCGFAATVSITP